MGQTLEQMEIMLTENGFRKYSNLSPISHRHAYSRWQLRVVENGETKYFISAFLYRALHKQMNNAMELEAALYQSGQPDDEWIILELHGCSDIDRALTFFAEAYAKLNCEPDRHNN